MSACAVIRTADAVIIAAQAGIITARAVIIAAHEVIIAASEIILTAFYCLFCTRLCSVFKSVLISYKSTIKIAGFIHTEYDTSIKRRNNSAPNDDSSLAPELR